MFIIVADVLQRLTANVSLAVPHRLTARIPYPILNFQYADDTILIALAKGSTIRLLLLAVDCFTAASGLKVNLDKSTFIPLSIQQHLLQQLGQLLQCKQGSLPITYLGMPLNIRKPTRMDYWPLLEKLESRMQGWKARMLTRAGKLQLIKTVLSAIPMYFMSTFQLPKWLLNQIDAMRRQFLWTKNDDTRAIHLINWNTVCLPIQCGGMGVVNLQLQNMAMLMRWLWRIYGEENKLWATYARMIHATNPTPDGSLFLLGSGSFFWRSLMKLKPLFSNSTRFRMGSGKQVSLWFDRWNDQPLLGQGQHEIAGTRHNKYISVFQAKQRATHLFPTPLTYTCHQVMDNLAQFVPSHGKDELMWNLNASSQFTVKSLYKTLSQGGKTGSATAATWKARVTPSMKFFFFLFIRNRLLTQEMLQKRNISYQPGCVMCGSTVQEDAKHLFFHCSYANQLWHELSLVVGYTMVTVHESTSQTYLISLPTDTNRRPRWTTTFITAIWLLWRERNERTFRNKRSPVSVLLNRAIHDVELYLKHC